MKRLEQIYKDEKQRNIIVLSILLSKLLNVVTITLFNQFLCFYQAQKQFVDQKPWYLHLQFLSIWFSLIELFG